VRLQRPHQAFEPAIKLGALRALVKEGLGLGGTRRQAFERRLEFVRPGLAITQRAGRQQRHLGAARVQQVDVGFLHRLQGTQLIRIELLGRGADAPHVKDAERADRRADRRDHEKAQEQPGGHSKILEPLHCLFPFMAPMP